MVRNNFDAIRLTAAGLVLFGHSYEILGLPAPLFLSWVPIHALGVYIFFAISGYLITESWDRDPHAVRFFARRALRIFPGLAVCVLLTVLVFGPMFSTLRLKEYFDSPHTWEYLHNIRLYIIFYLPGVFAESRVPNAVNGSLWSLPVEVLMYAIVAVAAILRSNRWLFASLAIGSGLLSWFWAQRAAQPLVVYGTDVRQVFLCGVYFWAGAVFYKFGLKRYFGTPATLLACIALFCLQPWPQVLSIAAWMLVPLAVLSFGFGHSPVLARVTSTGDYSYGIYIYAFPIQQAVAYLWPEISVEIHLLACAALTLACAIPSWHFVEKRALELKPRVPVHMKNSPRLGAQGTLAG